MGTNATCHLLIFSMQMIMVASISGGFLMARMVKDLLANTGDLGLIPGSEGSPREGNGYLLQYSCLENPMDRGTW